MQYESIDSDLLNDPDALAIDRSSEKLWKEIISVGLHASDVCSAQVACLRLSNHPHENVRGNALLAIGHLARRFGSLDETAKAVVEAGLSDPSGYVRGQADSAADDCEHYLDWCIERPCNVHLGTVKPS